MHLNDIGIINDKNITKRVLKLLITWCKCSLFYKDKYFI